MEIVDVILYLLSALSVSNAYLGIELIPFALISYGKPADPLSAPFIALIQIETRDGKNVRCGGTLLSHNYVITAGKCVENASAILVHLGAHNITTRDKEEVVILAESWQRHESTSNNDIAVIKLSKIVTYTESIQPATLPPRSQANDNYVILTGHVYGWGFTEKHNDSLVLLYADMPIIDNQECGKSDAFICAAKVNGTGICTEDSGGPLVIGKVVVGLVHEGSCSEDDHTNSAAFTKLANYLDWIEEKTDVLLL